MPSLVFQPLVEVFLLVEQPRQRLSHWTQVLAPLDGVEAPPVATVDAYYDPTSNQAIFGLRYDELALGPTRLSYIVEVALLAEIGMIQPAELMEADRGRFVSERLAKCTLHVGDQRRIVSALVELVRRVRSSGQRSTAISLGMEMVPGDPVEPMLLAAKGTRDLAPSELRAARELAGGVARHPNQVANQVARQVAYDDDLPEIVAVPEPLRNQLETARHTPPARRLAAALPQDRTPRPSPNVVARPSVHRASTVMMSPTETEELLEAAYPREDVDVPTEPYLPAAGNVAEPGTIYARYLRSEQWVPSRIGTLSLKGAALMARALPRVEDRIDITLAFANYRALVRGAVEKISTMQEAATSGTTTFNVNFELDDGSRRELTALLTAARAAKVTLKPPPVRCTRRYSVAWPVRLGTVRGVVRAEALDVSTGGMFVRPLHALTLDANVTFTAVLDDGLAPVSGRSKVVRNHSDDEAKTVGRLPGYGLSIVEMAQEDRERWSAFLSRIERRSERRVLIGAAPARLAELQSGLEAVGYVVTGSSEPSALARLAGAEAHPVDAALIDASWLAAASSTRVEPLFAARKVPCVTVHGDAKRARIAVDQLLAVV